MKEDDAELLDFLLNAKPEQITLSEQQYDRLVKILDSEPQPNEKLRELLARKAPWESGEAVSDDFSRVQPTNDQESESFY